jgi:hypothetical protein
VALGERLQDEHCVRGREILEVRVARLEGLEHRLDGLDVRDGIGRRDECERVGDFGRKAFVEAQGFCRDARVFPFVQDSEGERRGVAADRRLGSACALLERPRRVALGSLPVSGENAPLEDRDRPAPAARRRILPALAVALARAVEPLARVVAPSLHHERKAGSRGSIAETRQLALPRVDILGIGKPGLAVPVAFLLAPVVLGPVGHGAILMETAPFHGLEFLTAPGRVFTPRATTEALVDAALAHIDNRPIRVADVGTGSGVIGVSIAAAAPQVEVYATDVNPDAVSLARANAERHGVGDRVHVLEGDLLGPVPGPVDLVVANLPYLPAGQPRPEYENEPPEAVYAPGDGLGPLRQLLQICEAGKLAMPGFALVQYQGDVLESDCQHLPQLRERLAGRAAAA